MLNATRDGRANDDEVPFSVGAQPNVLPRLVAGGVCELLVSSFFQEKINADLSSCTLPWRW